MGYRNKHLQNKSTSADDFDEMYVRFLIKDRNSKIAYHMRLYIVFCYKRGYLDHEDFLLLFSFLESSQGGSNFRYILDDSGAAKYLSGIKTASHITVIDLRYVISVLQEHVHEYDWSELEGYI